MKQVCNLCLFRDLKKLELTAQTLNLKIEHEKQNSECNNYLLWAAILGFGSYIWLGNVLIANLIFWVVAAFVLLYYNKKRRPIYLNILHNEDHIDEIVCEDCLD